MSRDIPAGLETAIEQPVVRPFLAVRIEFPDPVYAWTGRGTLIFNDAGGASRNWIGTGELGALEAIGESTDGSASGVRATLNKIPAELADDIAGQASRGHLFEVYVGSLNETYQTVEAVALIWKGRLDQYKIHDAGDTLSVEVIGESRAIDQRRPAIKRFTDEYQQRHHPGDKFFEYVPQMTEVKILWAQASQNSTTSGSGFGGLVGNIGNIIGANSS